LEEVIVAKCFNYLNKIATFAVVAMIHGPAVASTFSGELPTGYSDSLFQIGGGTSLLALDINALGARDPTICASCNSIYTDKYTVSLFNQAGTLLESVNEINYLYYNMYSSSHGIGAGPVWVTVPAGATTLEIQSQLSIAGLLGADGLPLSFGNLSISSDGSIVAATPVPSTLPLMATGLVALGMLGWRIKRKGNGAPSAAAASRKGAPGALSFGS
jgi:hypothetical protein